ncbi:uncharacterized protein crybg2 [Anableps anableps]
MRKQNLSIICSDPTTAAQQVTFKQSVLSEGGAAPAAGNQVLEPGSLAREFSYSELDLRKPKRFATFSFGLRKRKKRDEENISKSAVGLHGDVQQEEAPVSHLGLDRAEPKLQLSLSQPELDTSGTFDIPSPPPLSSNRPENPLTPRTRPEPQELLSNGTPRAPIASIPELQPEDSARTQTRAVPGIRSKRAEPAVDLQNFTSGNTELFLENGNVSDAVVPTPAVGQEQRDSGPTLGEPEPQAALTPSLSPEPDPVAPCVSPDPTPSELPIRRGFTSEVRAPSQAEPPMVRTPPLLSPDPAAGFSGSGETKPAGVTQVPTPSPVSGPPPGTDSRASGSKRPVVPVRRSLAAHSSLPGRGMNVQETQDSSEPPGSDRALSPAYLSVGSDDGSTVDVYFSAPEENTESEEEMFTGEERHATPECEGGGETGGVQQGGGGLRAAAGQRSEDLRLLQRNSEFVLGPDPGTEGEAETAAAQVSRGGEGLPAPPVLQVNRLQECDSAPPSPDPPGQRKQAGETGALCAEQQKAPSLQGGVPVPESGRAREPGEEEEEEEEERACSSHTLSAAAGGTPDAASRPGGAGTVTQSVDGDAATQRQVSDEPSAPDARAPPPDLHPAEAAAHLDHSSQPSEPEPEPDDKMSSGFTSLSTKLTLKNSSPPREEEPKPRFHKVSLVTMETDSRSKPTDPELEYRWKNHFQGVTQYKSSRSSFLDDASSSHLNSLDSSVYLSTAAAGGWRRSLLEEEEEGEEPAASAGEEEERLKGEAEWRKPQWELEPLSASSCSIEDDDSPSFTGVFRATWVDLTSDPPSSPDVDSPVNDMDSLVDTLKSMGPSQRPRGAGVRAAPPALVSSLPPISEDTGPPIFSSLTPIKEDTGPPIFSSLTPISEDTGPPIFSSLTPIKEDTMYLMGVREVTGSPVISSAPQRTEEPQTQLYTLPADLGLKKNTPRDTRSPLELMKQEVMSSLPNGHGAPPSPSTSSRLDNSLLFSSFRSSSFDQKLENGSAHRSLFRASSLPDTGTPGLRLREPAEAGPSGGGDATGSRLERLSFLMNSSSSLNGDSSTSRISRAPSLTLGSPTSNSPTRLLSPTGSIDLHRPPAVSEPHLFSQELRVLQRSLSYEGLSQPSLFGSVQGGAQFGNVQGGPQFNNVQRGSQFQSQQDEPDSNLMSKYRAFPDAYLTKEKEHGKLNPRPGKIYIFDRPGMCGRRMEVRGDVMDATSWELQDTISIRVVRGGWVLYEKPNFKGEKVALDEGDMELTCPFGPPAEELQNGQEEKKNGETEEQTEKKPTRRFIIGSVRRAVRDYSVPEIGLFPEENAEGKKVVFRDTSEDARIFGFPIKANSIIVNAGLWLVFAQPFFQGAPRILEVGGYPSPAAWGVEQPYVGSLHPLKVGEPRVENMSEPKMVIYEKPYFSGKSRTISSNTRDFMSRTDRQQNLFMASLGSLKVLGGIWVGYEKEGFRGHQYLLEEGEYHDWRVWGGCNSELRSVRIIRADLTDPVMVMFEQPEEEQGVTEEKTFEVTEAIPDVELFDYKTSTRSIHVLSGAWIAYSHVDFSGNQFILEKGIYNNCADWGSQDTRVCSVQPILPAPADTPSPTDELILYSEPDFQGECLVFHHSQGALSEKFIIRSCRVVRGSWVLYENKQFSGNMYVLSEEDYPSLTSMGCPSSCSVLSVKLVPMTLSVPSISLFSLEGLEGREITMETEVISLVQEGFNDHVLSIRVNSGCWVLCEHSNYRGRQFLLEPIEITNWPKFSSLDRIGSMYPVRQKRHIFRVKNMESGHFLSVQGGVEELKSGRVVATAEVEPLSDLWFYQEGRIKNKLSPTMCLQVMGSVEPAAKVVLWNETRQPVQTWSAKMSGLISSLTFPGMVLDVKGGKTYDKEHVVVMPENDERPTQQWQIQLL